MIHRRLSVDWPLLERAFTDYSGRVYMIDTKTGRLIWASPKADPAEREAMDRKRFHPHGRYVEIEPLSACEEEEDLHAFLEDGVPAEVLPLLSRLAWGDQGVARQFERLLRPFPTEQERWKSFRTGRLRWRIRQFLADAGIALDESPMIKDASQ